MASIIDFNISPIVNSTKLIVVDSSTWDVAVTTPVEIDITLPVSETILTKTFTRNQVNTFFSYDLGLNVGTDKLVLIDGIYTFTVRETVSLTKTITYFKTDKTKLEFLNLYKGTDIYSIKASKLTVIKDIRLLIEAAEAAFQLEDSVKASEYLALANTYIADYKACKNCCDD